MYVTLVIQNISICAYLTNFWINSSLALFLFFFLHAIRSISHQYYYDDTNSSINIVFVIQSLTLSSILPLLLVLLFFSLLILYVLVIVSYFHCLYSHQVNITIIVSIISFVNFLIYIFRFHLWISASLFFISAFLFVQCLAYLFVLLLFCSLSWNYSLKIDNLIVFLWLP